MNRFVGVLFGLGSLVAFSTAMALPPTPAAPQEGPIAIVGATLHIGDGTKVSNGTITFADGLITAVGDQTIDTAGHQVIAANGQHLYPGFIVPDSTAGLVEVSSLADTVDSGERGDMNPSVRAANAFNTDSEMLPTMRHNGLLVAQVAPQGGLIAGQSSIMEMDAWNWEDALLVEDDGMFIEWPSKRTGQFDWSTFTFNRVDNENYDDQMARLEGLFSDARSYGNEQTRRATNLKLAALGGLFDGTKTLYVRSDSASDIVLAVKFARRHEVPRVVIIGADELLEVADYLVAESVPVIVTGTHRTPARDDDPIDQPFTLPARLKAKGLLVGLTYPSLMSSRNLGFIAGTAVAYGLEPEAAVRMLTLDNARILGIDDRLGSLAVGKHATLFVSQGDALEMRGNRLSAAFIHGRRIELDGMQQQLYKRYHERYSTP